MLCGCSSKPEVDFQRIYGRALKEAHREINPVIVIPGILGSKLVDASSGAPIWGAYDGKFANVDTPEGLRMLAVPLATRGQHQMTAKPDGVLGDLKFSALGLPVQLKAYSGILQTLGIGGFIDESLGSADLDWGSEHFTCFQFDYDWRLSNADNAARLAAFIDEKKSYIRSRSRELYGEDRPNVKFNIVAHSMGGLLARYYLRYGAQPLPTDGSLPRLTWAGARNVDKLVMVGTPNSGSVLAFRDVAKGVEFLPDWQRALLRVNLPNFEPAVIGSFPAMYEIMPRVRHEATIGKQEANTVDIYDVALWERYGWGLLADGQDDILEAMLPSLASRGERREVAKDYLARQLRNARTFHRALDRKAATPVGLKLYAMAGDNINTARQMTINEQSGEIADNDYQPGDGLVLRTSMLGDERVGQEGKWQAGLRTAIDFEKVIFLPEEHLDLTRSDTFTDNVLHILLEES